MISQNITFPTTHANSSSYYFEKGPKLLVPKPSQLAESKSPSISSFSFHFLSISSFSLHFLILSQFPLHFLILSPFSDSLSIFLQPGCQAAASCATLVPFAKSWEKCLKGTQTKPISKVGQGLIRLKVVEILSERTPGAFCSHYFWCCGGQNFSVNEILKCQINRKMLFDKSEERIRMIQSERAGSTYISAFIIPVHTHCLPNAILAYFLSY